MTEIYEPPTPAEGFSFGGEKPTPCDPDHKNLAEALFRLLDARDDLRHKMESVPSYTGQWRVADYYADEQETYNRCVDEFGDAVRKTRGELPL